MAELEIPEQEIQSLKAAFQFFVQETLSGIAGLAVHTSGYLRAELGATWLSFNVQVRPAAELT